MSRIGKQKVELPEGTTISIDGSLITVKGKLGELKKEINDIIEIKVDGNIIEFIPKEETSFAKAMWGTSASLVKNMIDGVNQEFEKKLQIEGIGFKAEIVGKTIKMALGFSHPVIVDIPDDVSVEIEKNIITVKGMDKEKVGQFAATIRAKRKPGAYKGEGIRYVGEFIIKKEGKKSV